MSKLIKTDDSIVNSSDNRAFSDLVSAQLSRRSLLKGGAGAVAAGLFSPLFAPLAGIAQAATPAPVARAVALAFEPVPIAVRDSVVVPDGYTAEVLYAWGDPTGIRGRMPAFKPDASNTAAEQAVQAGMHHDGMAYFTLPFGAQSSRRGLLAINHEYIDDGLLHPDGMKDWSEAKVAKAQAAVGVSVIEVEHAGDNWRVVRPSSFARRITAQTPCDIAGPARGHALMRTEADPKGTTVLGTFNNCANGQTPWGTYLTCEENWSDFFANNGTLTEDDKRYGIKAQDAGYRWSERDFRFDRQVTPNEPYRFGWVVEIDPYDAKSRPVKRTALGRVKHEGATVSLAPDGRVVVYMGDDQRFEYIYKFVSSGKYKPHDRKANRTLLDQGTLYVARFDDDNGGRWLPLVHGQHGLTADNGFRDQAEVLIHTRRAADKVGATKMDRPEWIAVHPERPWELYCTLTNNSERGTDGKPGTDAANPRAKNIFGHIIRWQEAGNDPTSDSFKWDLFALAGNPTLDGASKGTVNGDAFGSPDGLKFSSNGILWIQTDVSTSTLNQKEYANMGNNQMLATLPENGQVRRFLTGPNGCEITGLAFTPDNRTMFVNIQHPGETSSERSDPAQPKAVSSWPDGDAGGRPRSATVVIRRRDGGVIGV